MVSRSHEISEALLRGRSPSTLRKEDGDAIWAEMMEMLRDAEGEVMTPYANLWSIVRQMPGDQLERLAEEGVIDLDQAMSAALISLARTAAEAEDSVRETVSISTRVKDFSRKIDAEQAATRAVIESLLHAG